VSIFLPSGFFLFPFELLNLVYYSIGVKDWMFDACVMLGIILGGLS